MQPLVPVHTILSRLRLRQLMLLIALEEHSTLNRAADHLGISQPGATKALNELEALFGTKLFERTAQGLIPNEFGRCVTRYARLIHSDLYHMREEFASIRQGTGGRLSVGAISGAIPYVSSLLSKLTVMHPEVHVTIIEGTSDQLLGHLDEGRLELVFCRSAVSQNEQKYQSLEDFGEQMALIVNPRHALCGQSSVSLRDLAGLRWVVYASGMPMRVELERAFAQAGVDFPTNLIETSSALSRLYLVHENDALVAQTPHRVARFGMKLGMAVRLPLDIDSSRLSYALLKRKSAVLSSAAQLFLGILRDTQANALSPVFPVSSNLGLTTPADQAGAAGSRDFDDAALRDFEVDRLQP